MSGPGQQGRVGQAGEIAAWVTEQASASLPAHLTDHVLATVRDTIGCIVAGAREESTASVVSLVGRLSAVGGREPVRLEQGGRDAAMILGTAAHALDFDDMHIPTMAHVSGVVVPAALAVGALATEGRGSRLARALLLGQEVGLRIGEAVLDLSRSNSLVFARGFHPTPVCSVFGAAIAASVLLGNDREQTGHAIGIAASLASGLMESNRTGGNVKPFHSGWSASAGLHAAFGAGSGMTASPTALEGGFGFLSAFGSPEIAGRPVGSPADGDWLAPGIKMKLFPTNGGTHAPIEVALWLRERGYRPKHVERLTIGVARQIIPNMAEPRAERLRPKTSHHARFSGPIVVAAALRGGAGPGLALDDFPPELVNDQDLLALAERVHFVPDDWASQRYPAQLSAVGELVTVTGDQLQVVIDDVRGGGDRPITTQDVLLKYEANLQGRLPRAAQARLEIILRAVETWDAVAILAELALAFDRPSNGTSSSEVR